VANDRVRIVGKSGYAEYCKRGVEYNGAQSVYAALQRCLNSPAKAIGITRPTEPDYRGTLTVRHVYDAEIEAEFAARVHEWA